ncbi:cob(I)yrinic acid a,c-diamide adenosyltransferase [bacterium]|nr:cob(I)yrinic acid a,c-diamide adenosyltransferase [bacterium]
MKGEIQIYTGDCKGKTTAAIGLVIRATGQGLKTAFLYFDKGGGDYGERKIFDSLGIHYIVTGVNRILDDGSFRFSVTDEDKEEGKKALKTLLQLFEQSYDIIVCDEINVSTAIGILEESDVLDVLSKKPESTELVLTGRYAPESFVELASLVTEMKQIKHYFESGIGSRKGIEF